MRNATNINLAAAPRFYVRLLGLLWLGGALGFGQALRAWAGAARPVWLPESGLGLALGGGAALCLGVGLLLGRPWTRPVARLFHLWLAAAAWLAALLLRPYGWLAAQPWLAVFDAASRQTLIMLLFFLAGAASLLVVAVLARPRAWRDFAAAGYQPPAVCPVCGAEEKGEPCAYCRQLARQYIYYLEPLLQIKPAALRLPLQFEEGHWRLEVGREAPVSEVRLDDQQLNAQGQRAYATISRRHAHISLNPDSGQLRIAPVGAYTGVKINGQLIAGEAEVEVGDVIRLGKLEEGVDFLLGHPDDQPLPVEVRTLPGRGRHMQVLCQRRSRFTIGRGADNDVVLAEQQRRASRRHAQVQLAAGQLWIANLSEQENTLSVNNVALQPAAKDETGRTIPGEAVTFAPAETEWIDLDVGGQLLRLIPHVYQPGEGNHA